MDYDWFDEDYLLDEIDREHQEYKNKTMKCDRCSHIIDGLVSDNQRIEYQIVEVTADGRATLDLCPDCKNKLYRWIWKLEDK